MRLSDLPASAWPAELGFVPFVGEQYEDGIDGCRVVVLAESHYGKADANADMRDFTRQEFSDRVEPKRAQSESAFFKNIDRMLTGSAHIDPEHAAECWKQIAFANLVQRFVGETPEQRPTWTDFRDGTAAFSRALELLEPDVILVLGRATWDGLDAGAIDAHVAPYRADGSLRRKEREIWGLPYPGGRALMTWLYHPSRPIDRWEDMAGALRHLIAERNEQRTHK